MARYRIGVDLGGAKTEIALLSPAGETLLRRRVPTPVREGYGAVLENTASLIRETAANLPPRSDYSLGVGIPGAISPTTGLVQNANSTCLIGHPLQEDLQRALGRPLAMENDANCFALAESRAGAGLGFEMVFGVIMGSGCGGGLCLHGQARKGPHAIAGEWGHVSVDPLGATCYCGNRGCVETKISGSGVEAAFTAETGRRLPMRDIVSGARNGDAQCAAVFTRFLDDFGRCLAGLIGVLDPDAVVLGGGLSNINELYELGVERVRAHAFHADLRTPILKNELGDSAGVFGAAWIGV
jgi:fructokinase